MQTPTTSLESLRKQWQDAKAVYAANPTKENLIITFGYWEEWLEANLATGKTIEEFNANEGSTEK